MKQHKKGTNLRKQESKKIRKEDIITESKQARKAFIWNHLKFDF